MKRHRVHSIAAWTACRFFISHRVTPRLDSSQQTHDQQGGRGPYAATRGGCVRPFSDRCTGNLTMGGVPA